MSEPTITLQNLRRAIARELEMPFFKRYKNGFLDADSGTTVTLVDTALAQKDKFWNGAWVYRVATQEASQIVNFIANEDKVYLEVPVTTFAAGDDYEIHNIWNAFDIHEAINQAIHDSRRIFFDTVTDETLVVQENVLAYSLSSLAKVPHMIQKIWIEQPSSVRRNTAADGTSSTLIVNSNAELVGLASGWLISIYGGWGAGQLRTVSTATGVTITPTAAWTTTPDNTSKWAAWNPAEQIQDWRPWHSVRYDSMKEFPDVLYFSSNPTDFHGLRIRLEYVALPADLSTEISTTVIPESYLIPAAISKLHGRKVKDTKVDRELHFAESKRYQEMADAWMVRNAPHRPDSNILNQAYTGYQPSSSDPLNWSGY